MTITGLKRASSTWLAAFVIVLAAGCAENPTSLAEEYARAYGQNGDTSRRVSTSSVEIDVMTASVDRGATTVSATFRCYGESISEGAIFFTDGTSIRAGLKGNSGVVTGSSAGTVWYLRARDGSGDYWYFDKSGDYWYFDRGGVWAPPSPTVEETRTTSRAAGGRGKGKTTETRVREIVSTAVNVDADPVFSTSFDGTRIGYVADFPIYSVTARFKQGDSQTFDTSTAIPATPIHLDLGARGSDVSLITFETVNGWGWSYDTNLQFVWDDTTRTASSKQSSGLTTTTTSTVTVTMPDVVTAFFLDYSATNYQGLSLAFVMAITYGKPVDGYRLLKSDGSKWYFDRYGNMLPFESKWYQDMD